MGAAAPMTPGSQSTGRAPDVRMLDSRREDFTDLVTTFQIKSGAGMTQTNGMSAGACGHRLGEPPDGTGWAVR